MRIRGWHARARTRTVGDEAASLMLRGTRTARWYSLNDFTRENSWVLSIWGWIIRVPLVSPRHGATHDGALQSSTRRRGRAARRRGVCDTLRCARSRREMTRTGARQREYGHHGAHGARIVVCVYFTGHCKKRSRLRHSVPPCGSKTIYSSRKPGTPSNECFASEESL
jgi:hypothetical protein